VIAAGAKEARTPAVRGSCGGRAGHLHACREVT
jgi:hypothetical protein